MSLITLDVFDTCLVRTVADPASVWVLVARRLRAQGIDVGSDADFVAARSSAEDRVRDASAHEDVTLTAVAAGMSMPSHVDAIVAAELAAERSVLRRHPGILTLVDDVRGHRIAYLSDTPLPSAFLRDVLDEHGLPAGPVFSSGDRGLRKATGNLFRTVCAELGVDPRTAEHVGDNAVVDGYGAARAGVRFHAFASGNLNRYERILDSARNRAHGLLGAKLAGASRLARLQRPPANGVVSVAYSVAGPLLLASVLWSLQRAHGAGVRRLYFAARDGELPLRIAQLVQQRLGIADGVSCSYLYGSRRAWQASDDSALHRYLAQEGVLDPHAGVIDVGWSGRAVGGLLRAVAACRAPAPAVLLLGGRCGRDVEPLPVTPECFLVDAPGRDIDERPAVVHLLESFCQGHEGSTTGYVRAGDRWVAQLDAPANTAAIAWGLDEFQAAVLGYVETALDVLDHDDLDLTEIEQLAPSLVAVLRALWDAPDAAEVAAWASCPFDNPASTPVRTLARPLTARAIGAAIRKPRGARASLATGPWRAAALPRLPQVTLPAPSLAGARLRWAAHGGRRAARGHTVCLLAGTRA